MGESKNLWLAGVTSDPPVSSARRAVPKNTGMRLTKIKAAGTSQRPRALRGALGLSLVSVPITTVAVFLLAFISNPSVNGPEKPSDF